MQNLEANRVLAALPQLRAQTEILEPPYGDTLIEQGEPSPLVYFPLPGAVLSLTRAVQNGTQVEVGVIGFEGIGGIAGVLDPRRSIDRGVVQAEGTFATISVAAFTRLLGSDDAVRALFFRYTNAFLMQVAQTALCNRLHLLEQRLARWLLMMHDRVQCNEMRMTQEFLSHMLGTRVAGVNEAVASLVRAGLIAHTRQRVTVLDRGGLEAAACECYAVARDEMERATI
ncbi:MAG TPA: Crp/Fnr family transcriptional regulator [Thermoanaerobaculia bacterium]|nr:Crp/Fnr family transcriptional regulator [Thermoanaerobaculia bacterium]